MPLASLPLATLLHAWAPLCLCLSAQGGSALVLSARELPAQEPSAPAAPATVEVARRVAAMGTRLAIEVEAADRPAGLAASEAAVQALAAVEARLSTWREDSELARLNAAPAGTFVPISPALEADLRAARRWSEATSGAFDPGLGALVAAWGLRQGGRAPTEHELAEALAGGGVSALELRPGAARRTDARMRLEEGGFGKGVGLDAALAALAQAGATLARLDLGGQLAVLGTGGRFELELADPRDRQRPVLALAIERGSVATSGNSEHGIVVAGRHLGHLLDPRSGRPAADFGSLSVWAPDATAADCLSTGLYVLGPDAALAWAGAHEGVEVLVLERGAAGLRARASAGWHGRARALVADIEIDIEHPPAEDGARRPAARADKPRPHTPQR